MALCLQPDCWEVSGVGRTDPAAGSNLLLGTVVVGVEGAGGDKNPPALLVWEQHRGKFLLSSGRGRRCSAPRSSECLREKEQPLPRHPPPCALQGLPTSLQHGKLILLLH